MTVELQRDNDGRWVGSDGFVVPVDFGEFFSRYPGYAAMLARKWRKGVDPDVIEDLAQEIWAELLRKRAVERFDPEKMFGANSKQFFFYVTRCIRNVIIYEWREHGKEPISTALGIDDSNIESTTSVTEEQLHASRAVAVPSLDVVDKLYLDGLRGYLAEHGRTDLIDLMDAVTATKNYTQAAISMGVKPSTMHHRMKKLRLYARQYEGRK